MPLNYQALLTSPAFRLLAVPAIVTLRGGVILGTVDDPMSAIDKSAGVTVPGEVETIRPAAVVQAAELIARGLSIADFGQLDDGTIALNSLTFTILAHRSLPRPTGLNQGEVYLLLESAVLG